MSEKMLVNFNGTEIKVIEVTLSKVRYLKVITFEDMYSIIQSLKKIEVNCHEDKKQISRILDNDTDYKKVILYFQYKGNIFYYEMHLDNESGKKNKSFCFSETRANKRISLKLTPTQGYFRGELS